MPERTSTYSTIAEMTDGIILSRFEKDPLGRETAYQSEAELERQLIENLVSQGYKTIFFKTNEQMYENLREKIETLNKLSFTDKEWERFKLEYLDAPNDGMIEKTRKIQENHIYDFTFDDGHLKNIKIIDKKDLHNNSLQVTSQVVGERKNRYDVTILVNGLPLVHIELKRRGVKLQEAFNQIHRYSRESFNSDNSLYKYCLLYTSDAADE